VLYELLTGRHPFDAPDERTAAQRIRHDHPTALTRALPDLPGSLERAVHRCLEKMPSDRFHDAVELERALKGALKELGGGSTRELIGTLLVRAGLSSEAPPPEDAGPRSQFIPEQPSLRPALIGLGIAAALLLVGSGAIYLLTSRADRGAGRASHPLELVPASAAFLRVVADPWAHVVVDGQRVDTTPFARPIPLPAGTHYVRLEHPNAPAERRTISLAPGETVLLDVKMNVLAPPSSSSSAGPAEEPPDGGVDAGPPSP
jgi:serine/threonine-protein kinase